MTSTAYFWAIAGFMAGLAAAFFALRLWRSRAEAITDRNISGRLNGWLLAAVAVFLIGALMIYAKVGRPPVASAAPGMIAPDHAATQAGKGAAGSLTDVTMQLANKLAKGEGTDADWLLLQQSYEFLGDTASAALAAQHKLANVTPATANVVVDAVARSSAAAFTQATNADLAVYQKRVADNPKDAAAWRALAESYRRTRQFKQATDAFAELIKLKAMDAGAWADYADAAASQQGSLNNEQTRTALQAALKLNATHPKALWLQASLLLEAKHYAESLKVWRQLRAVIPDASPDAKIVDANIAEAQSLATPAVSSKAAAAAVINSAAVQGSINIDAALTSKTAGMTLFVFAKAVDSPAPVAVYRTTVAHWPVRFTLDDSQAMMPIRKLSNYAQVQVQARLSQSGQAMAQPGDWQSDAVTVATRQGKAVTLLINQPVNGKAGT